MNKTYFRRKEQGLCVYCGRNKAREGRVLCEHCAEKKSKLDRETKDLQRSRGFCTVCGKNKIKGGEKICLDCLDKRYVWNMNNREKNAQYCANRKIKLKEQGVCADCGQEKAAVGRVRCEKCLARRREYARESKAFSMYRMPKGGYHEKAVQQIEPKTNKVIHEYSSVSNAIRSLNLPRCGNISKCCNGKRKTAFGYVWRYKEVNDG